MKKKLQMETMAEAARKALAAAPNAAAACLLGQRVPQSAPEVCLARGNRPLSLSGPDAAIIDPLLSMVMREPRAEERTRKSHFWVRFWHKAPEAARLRPWALQMSSGVMRRRPAHLETKGAAMPAQQASAEKVQLGIS